MSTPTPPSGRAEAGRDGAGDGRSLDPLGLFGSRVAGRLAVVRYLGATASAHVYRVVHTLMDRPCFLKAAEADDSTDDGMPALMKREAQLAGQVDAPVLLKSADAGVVDGVAYLAQEWSDGPNLRSIMNQGADVSVPDLLGLGLRLLEGICELHRRGVVVRSFNPERILFPDIGGKPALKLFDLSRFAYVGEEGPPEGATRDGQRHGTGFVIRSSRYMAPEEIREVPADPRSDLYSFGVLLAEMITGEYPYETRGSGPTAYVASHLRDEPRPIVLGPSDGVPTDLPAIIRRLLAKSPEDRFETGEAARRAIEDVVVPDLLRLNTSSERHVLDAWRKRVKNGLGSTIVRRAYDEEDG